MPPWSTRSVTDFSDPKFVKVAHQPVGLWQGRLAEILDARAGHR